MPILASVAPSDSTSQCNYRTREDLGVSALPSLASAEVSYGEGLGGTHGQLALSSCINGTISQNAGTRAQRLPGQLTVTSNSQPQDVQAFDYNAPKTDHPTEPTSTYNFNLLSPYDLQ